MSLTNDSLAYGYDEFYTNYSTIPPIQCLLELTSSQLIHPSCFDAHNPRHVCLSALHGFVIYPFNERLIKERVNDNAPYSKTVASRIEAFRAYVTKFNADQQSRLFAGSRLVLKIEDEPFTLEQFKLFGLDGTELAEAALAFEADRKYFTLGKAGRLNHFSQHHGFSNFQELKSFLNLLDVEAQGLGYQSYASICASSRYMGDMEKKYENQVYMLPVVNEMRQKWDLLKRESVFTIECFIKCRVAGDESSYFLDVNDEGVELNLYEGCVTGRYILSSKFMSDKNDDFHLNRDWFVSQEDAS